MSRFRSNLLVAVLALTTAALLSAPSAEAEMYRWTDDEGKLHFTSDPENVPEQYRAHAEWSPNKQVNHAETTRKPRDLKKRAVELRRATLINERPLQIGQVRRVQPVAPTGPLTTPEKYRVSCNKAGDRCKRIQTEEFRAYKADPTARAAARAEEDDD